jgi:dTDP-4-dehydrorhamnose 3,5-epimerase
MSRFEVMDTPLAGLKRVQRHRLGDSRGFLSRLFCAEELALAGWHLPIAQLNHTYTARRGTVRGLHFQRAPHAEAKLVSCLRGEVWDLAVDLRPDSATFGRWHAVTLSADNGCALLIPEGFAHGFQALSDDVELLYCHSAAFAPQAEAGLHPQCPQLAIAWPLVITELSARDAGHAGLASLCRPDPHSPKYAPQALLGASA